MAADVRVMVSTGAGPTDTDVTALGPPNIRMKTNDNATIDVIDPLPIPGAGTIRSYWKHMFLKAFTAPAVQIDNVKWYMDGTLFVSGVTLQVGNQTPTKNSGSSAGYDQATGTPGADGDELVANHANITTKANANTKTSGAPLSVSISEAGSIIDAINELTDYVVVQMDVDSTPSPGDLADETVTFEYDEI
jgi:hypothetical protein